MGVNDFKDQRLADLLPVLQPDDVVCLQELFWTTGPRKQRFLNALVEEGLIHYASSPIPYLNGLLHWPPKIIDAGLVIASRRPIIETDYFTFSRASVRSIDIIVAKGVLYARICIFGRPQKYAHVFTMHLQANNGLEDEPFDEIRRSQLEEIVSFVKDKTSDDPLGTIILAGDFNVDARKGFSDGSSSEEYNAAVDILKRIRTEEVLNDVLFQANGEHPVTSAGGLYGKTGKRERLDYIFMLDGGVSGDVNVCVRNGSVAVDELSVAGKTYSTMSDHYAVKADFVFERGTEG